MMADARTLMIVGGGVAVIAVVMLLIVALRRGGGRSLPVFPTPVLTKAEIAFHHRLMRIVARIDGIQLFPQVAMGAIMDADRGMEKGARQAVRNRFDRKIVDFVVVDRETNVLLLIELDDSTHDSQRDRDRDEITRSAGYGTMRIRGKAARDDVEIERLLRAHLSARPS